MCIICFFKNSNQSIKVTKIVSCKEYKGTVLFLYVVVEMLRCKGHCVLDVYSQKKDHENDFEQSIEQIRPLLTLNVNLWYYPSNR